MAQRQINPYLFVARIAAILGMSITLAVAILAVIGALWVLAGLSLLVAVPFIALMLYVERGAQRQV